MADYEKLSKGLLTEEDIERLVDECIPLENPSPFISAFGSVNIEDLNKAVEQINQNKSYIDLVREIKQSQEKIKKAIPLLCDADVLIMKKEYAKANLRIHKAKEILKGSDK